MTGLCLLLKDPEHQNPAEIRNGSDRHVLQIVKLEPLQHERVEVGGSKVHRNVKEKQKGDEFALIGLTKAL